MGCTFQNYDVFILCFIFFLTKIKSEIKLKINIEMKQNTNKAYDLKFISSRCKTHYTNNNFIKFILTLYF